MIADANILLITYALLGPLPWLLLLALMLLGRERMMRLKRKVDPLPENPPHVTVIIPAKDEGAGIARCIERVLALDYPSFDVIAVNDRSGDDTGAILDSLSRESTRLRIVHIAKLPDGWLGKCNALHVGSRDARGDWLLFVDSDVSVEPAALRHTLGMCEQRKYDALSILTRLECHGFFEQLVLPLAAGAWSFVFTISLTNDDDAKDSAAANGQFFLIRRAAYESVHGHEAVRDRIVEDVELARLLKSRGFRTRVFFGNHLASTRMHSTWRQMLHGWGRIYSGTARRKTGRIIAAMLFVLIAGFSLYPAMVYGVYDLIAHHSWYWLAVSGVHAILLTLVVSMIYRGAGIGRRFALLFPISASALIVFFAYALRLCRTGQITWRGTQFSSRRPPQAASTD
ncbi:MAG: glycosyltransferase [Anaerolineae bacterium]|nr:glycosyltransferase [Phycisphaerae bacterium]